MKAGRILLLLVLSVILFGCATIKYKSEEEYFNYIDIRTGVKIYFIPGEIIFPDNWYEKPINASYKLIERDEIERSISILLKALNKYPLELIKDYLTHIYYFRELMFYEVEYGGTYSGNTVYLVNDGVINLFTDDYLEKTFHHEFSSILLKEFKYKFNEEEWLEISTQTVEYGEGGVEALKSGKFGLEGGYMYYKDGFLSEYSTSGMEEDFNVYVQTLFTEPEILFELCEKHPLIKKKCELIIEFYNTINSIFTREYFMEINTPD